MSEVAKTLPLIFLKDWILVCMLIFGGCCSNLYSLEVLTVNKPKSGNLITFAQIFIVALEGFFNNVQIGWKGISLKPRNVPIRYWLVMVSLFLTVSVMNNYALGFNISMYDLLTKASSYHISIRITNGVNDAGIPSI
jgi:solute carrier family 35 (UDP-xylose/UDP-N-acetylglucosamine transporter), member B4